MFPLHFKMELLHIYLLLSMYTHKKKETILHHSQIIYRTIYHLTMKKMMIIMKYTLKIQMQLKTTLLSQL